MIQLLYIDLFCGAGGTTSGIEYARLHGRKCAKVVACVNHDANAIASHKANHPDALHFTEDIRTLALNPLVKHVEKMKRKYPRAKTAIWASLECTNFSNAKGGMPRNADSRTLAEHLFRYIETINPDYIMIENVREFQYWGDLDENGKPVSKDKGRLYLRWVSKVKSYGYNYDYRILNSADFGAYTSRRRFFGLFAKYGLPLAFPIQTFAKNGDEGGMFHQYKKWRPVREVLDLDDKGESIFDRKKPLCEKTLERIYSGLVKFVARDTTHCKAKFQFLSKQFSGSPDSKNISIDGPAGTLICIDHHAFLTAYYGNGFNTSLEVAAPTIPTKDRLALLTTKVSERFLMNPYSYKSDGCSIDKPCFTLIARMDKMPIYLTTTKEGDTGIVVYDTDSKWTRKIKEFMAQHGIIDIFMRMLNIQELKRIQGFPDNYILIGTQAEQKKYIGNAVEVNTSRVLCEALAQKIELC